MQSIPSLSLAPGVIDWLANTRHPRILHVFDHACNLINEHRDVLSIVTPQIGNGPFNLVIGDDVLFPNYLYEHLLISIDSDQLHLGDLIIHTADAKLWTSRPDWERLHTERDRVLCGLKSCLRSWKSASADSYIILNPKSPIANSLSFALATADVPASISAAEQLAGLGIGLTPAGDDFIMGAMYAAWIIHPIEVAGVLANEIAKTTAPLTTSLSAAWLKSARKGEAGNLWHEFFDVLTDLDTVRIQAAMDKILAVGATSGADALAGFIGAFFSYAEHETKLCHS